MYQPPQSHSSWPPFPPALPPAAPAPSSAPAPRVPWPAQQWGLLLSLGGAALLVLAAFPPWLRVHYGTQDTLHYSDTGTVIAMPHLSAMALEGLPFWLTLVYAALLAGLAIDGLRAAATGWGTPSLTAWRLLLVSGFAALLMLHELFSFLSALMSVDSIASSGVYSSRFIPGLGLFVGPLGALLALMGALMVLEWARRAAVSEPWLSVADAPAQIVPAMVHDLLPARAQNGGRLLLRRWRAVLTRPTRASFEPEVAGAGWSGAVVNVGALVGVQVIVGLLCGTLSFGEIANDVMMTPVGFFLLAGALFLASRMLAGSGSLAAHMHFVALGWAPAAALASVALGVGVPVVSGLAGVALGGYGIYLAVVAMLTVHDIGGQQASQPARLAAPTGAPHAIAPQPAATAPALPHAPATTPLAAIRTCAAGHLVDDAGAQLCPLCGAAV
jgi:hypothetical protein